MNELEQLKAELEKYKQENQNLRFQISKVKSSISFRLGYILVMGVQNYKDFFKIPYSLLKLRQDLSSENKGIAPRTNKNIQSIVFSDSDQIILRDALVESSILINSNELYLNGTIYADTNEKNNAALLAFTVDGTKSLELAKALGLKWSPNVGMYTYLPTGAGEREFQVKLNNLANHKQLNVLVRRWHSKGPITMSGKLTVTKSQFEEMSDSSALQKYVKILQKHNIEKLVKVLSADKKLSVGQKNIILVSLMLRLEVQDREDLSLLLRALTVGNLKEIKSILGILFDHFYKMGLYEECSTLLKVHKVQVSSIKREYIADALYLLREGVNVPARNQRAIAQSSVVKYAIHCSLPHHSNGYATRSHSVLTALNDHHLNVSAITRPGYPWDVRLAESHSDEHHYVVDGISYEHIDGPIQRECSISSYIDLSARAIEAHVIRNGARLIHACSNYMTAYPALIAARRLGLPFVYEVRGFWEITELSRNVGWEKSSKFQLDKKLETELVREADAVITLTQAMKTEISSRGVSEDKIFVVPNAVDIEKFSPLVKDHELAKSIGLNTETIIGYVGSIVDYEGLDDLLIASKKLLDAGLIFELLIVGDGAALPSLKQLAKTLNISEKVVFTGRVSHEEVKRYYSLIDIAPFPRKSLEVCELVSPLKPFEAMALRKAVVASSVRAIGEFIEDGVNGLLFEKGSIESLAEKLKTLIQNSELRNQLSRTGFEWVKKNRNWAYTTGHVKDVYQLAEKNALHFSNEKIHDLKEVASYFLSNWQEVELSSSPSIDIMVDSDSCYQLSGKHTAVKNKSGIVVFDFTPKLDKKEYQKLGFSWSERYGAFRYLPIQKGNNYTVPFQTAHSTKLVSIAFHEWASNANVNHKIGIQKKFNDISEAKKALINNDGLKKIAIYGDVNTNLIDGASIWLISLAKALAKLSNVEVYVILKDTIKNTEVIDDSYLYKNIYLIEPSKGPMKPASVVESIRLIEDNYGSFDAVVVRGSAVCHALSNAGILDGRLIPYLTDIPQSEYKLTNEWKSLINDIVYSSRNVLCQTKELQSFFSDNFPKANTSLLPPMVPSSIEIPTNKLSNGALTMVYAGKFAPEWGIRELFSVFKKLRAKYPSLELHVYGDKIHNPKEDPGFYNETLENLESGNGVIWHGRASRQKVLNALGSSKLAWAWRHSSLEDNTKELSTKLLEYGLAKVPVILNGSPLYRDILGSEYELFASNEEELIKKAEFALKRKNKEIKKLTRPLEELVKVHSFEYVANHHLKAVVDSLPEKQSSTILLAGHDLKFFTHIEAQFKAEGYRVLVDKWQGHNKHDESKSTSLLAQSDVVICEWSLGNAVWYSKKISDKQSLHIRVHGQEVKLDYFNDIKMENVNSLNFVSQHLLYEALEKYQCIPVDKCQVIPNYVLTEKLNRPKLDGAEFNIGLVGIVPEMKRLDKALDILERIRKSDKRYKLYIKGKKPEDYAWMKNRPEEMAYYDKQYARIEKSTHLKKAVFFDGFGSDMAEWYRKVGFVLSTSDYESFHLSVADCAASSGVPVVLNWPGAKELYSEFVFNNIEEAADAILNNVVKTNPETFAQSYSLESIFSQWVYKI